MVMLSAAKHLPLLPSRPFASLRVTWGTGSALEMALGAWGRPGHYLARGTSQKSR